MIAVIAVVSFAGIAHAEFDMAIDRNLIDFRTMDPGQTKELADQGVYHNQVSCTSDNDRSWYLKTYLARPFTSAMNTIPNENFYWIMVSKGNGRGIITNNVNTETAFTTFPSVLYTSAETDNTGTPVALQLRYVLKVPKDQLAGSYDSIIRFSMIETL